MIESAKYDVRRTVPYGDSRANVAWRGQVYHSDVDMTVL
jgi:hypothetical protein